LLALHIFFSAVSWFFSCKFHTACLVCASLFYSFVFVFLWLYAFVFSYIKTSRFAQCVLCDINVVFCIVIVNGKTFICTNTFPNVSPVPFLFLLLYLFLFLFYCFYILCFLFYRGMNATLLAFLQTFFSSSCIENKIFFLSLSNRIQSFIYFFAISTLSWDDLWFLYVTTYSFGLSSVVNLLFIFLFLNFIYCFLCKNLSYVTVYTSSNVYHTF